MADALNPASTADALASKFPQAWDWLTRILGDPIADIIPGTASNEEFTATHIEPALDELENLFRNAPAVGPTTHMGIYSRGPVSESGESAAGQGASTNAAADQKVVNEKVAKASQLSREQRLANIIAAARNPQRADRDADLLTSSINRPLVYSEGVGGQKSPFTTTRMEPGWRSGTSDARTVVTYSEDDVLEPATWGAPEKVGRLQHHLVNAGVLMGDFAYGMYDEATSQAYRALLTFASYQGMTSDEALVEMHARRREAEKQGLSWNPTTQTEGGTLAEGQAEKPDPAVARQAVKQWFRDQLDREPDADELADFAAEFHAASMEAAGYDPNNPEAEVGMAERVWDDAPELAAMQAGQGTEGSDNGTGINAAARFKEAFDQRYAGEKKFKKEQTTNMTQGSLLENILGTISEAS